jgi:hypothetical protein
MKTALIALLMLAAVMVYAQEKQLICTYDGMVTLEEPGFWLQSKKDKGWYKIVGVDVVKSYRPTEGEVCAYR